MSDETIQIRAERPDDIAAIRRIIGAAFGTKEEVELVDALRLAGKIVISLVAVDGETVVGHILFSRVSLNPPVESLLGIGLAPMSVTPERQRQGLGSQLVRRGLELCRKQGFDFAVVLGHPGFYPRFGFVPSTRFNLKSEYDVAEDVFMVMEFTDGSLQGVAGTVKYESEFSAF